MLLVYNWALESLSLILVSRRKDDIYLNKKKKREDDIYVGQDNAQLSF